MKTSKISIIIPCYGSEATIENVVGRVSKTINAHEGYDYEVILVNDSSPDNVIEVMIELTKRDSKVKVIDLSRNFGQHSALMTGFWYSSGDLIVCLDDDGQTPPEEMFCLIEKMEEGNDVVFARYDEKKHSFFRRFGSRINDYMARVLIGKPKNLQIMSYFACKKFIAQEIKKYENPYPYIGGLLLRSTNKICNVTVKHEERKVGASGYTFKKLLSLWLNGFTAFSIKPLRMATMMGIVTAILGAIYGFYTVLNKLVFNPNAPMGYSSLMTVLLFVGGMLMFLLGIIGEYVGRTYISINKSPQFIVRKTYNIEE